jgi:Fur family transcriptional regulator, ferric uptake regulator
VSRRDDVLATLAAAPGFLAAQQVYTRLRARQIGIGLATVYRVLAALEAEGVADVVRSAGGETLYRLCRSSGHHHHLLCRDCGRAEELDAAVVERWAAGVAREHGFDDVSHTVEIVGRCSRCRG